MPDLLKVVVICLISPFPVFAVLKKYQRKKLRRKYDHRSFANEDLDVFNRESKIRKEIKHERIRKLKSAFTERTVKLTKIGHFYLERVTCNLHEYPAINTEMSNATELTKDLLRGIDYLHTEAKIIHGTEVYHLDESSSM